MEAASRPPPEALPDLPEEPPNPAKVHAGAAAAPGAVPASEAAKPKDPEQTGLNFVDPEMFLAPGQAASAVPVVNAAEQSAKAPEPALELELSLLDDHDRIGQLTRPHAKFEPRRNPEDTPGEALGERAAKQRAGALVRGHHGLSGRPKAGKSSG